MIYFDNAATTFPKPEETIRAMNMAMRIYGANPGRSGHNMSLACAEKVYECRELAAELFGCPQPENVVFTQNCTHAVNLVVNGAVPHGGHVVISDMEHNAVLRPVHRLAQKGAAEYSIAETFETDPDATVKSFSAAMRPNTALILLSHASNITGSINFVRKISEMAHQKGAYIMLDAAQSAGVLPINMQRDGIDFLCVPGHKGLYGPMGTGMLLTLHPNLPEELMSGGTGSNSLDYSQPDFLPDRLESGTVNLPGIIALGAGMRFVRRIGINRLHEYESGLACYIAGELSQLPYVQLYGADKLQSRRLPVIALNLKNFSGEQTAEMLNRQGIAVRGGYQCAPLMHKKLGTLGRGVCRVSIGAFNNKKQADRFILAIKNIIFTA